MLLICNGMIRSGSTLQYNLLRTLLERTDRGHGHGFLDDNDFEAKLAELEAWADDQQCHVIKMHSLKPGEHGLDQRAGVKQFFTYRDIRDAAGSTKRKFRSDGQRLYDRMDHAVEMYFQNEPRAWVFKQRFETMQQDMHAALRELVAALQIDAADGLIDEVVAACSPEAARQRMAELRSRHKLRLGLRGLLLKLGLWKPLRAGVRKLFPRFSLGEIMDQKSLLHADHLAEKSGPARDELTAEERAEIDRRYTRYMRAAGYDA